VTVAAQFLAVSSEFTRIVSCEKTQTSIRCLRAPDRAWERVLCESPVAVEAVVVNAGDFCVLSGANVSGGVQVNGGILIACASTINGGLVANGAANVIIGAEEIGCSGIVINGGVHISNTGPGVIPGGAPSIALENSAIKGSVHLTGNQGPIVVANDTIAGGLFCSNNAFDLDDEHDTGGAPPIVTGPIRCKFAD
jgi:hypothetical protein